MKRRLKKLYKIERIAKILLVLFVFLSSLDSKAFNPANENLDNTIKIIKYAYLVDSVAYSIYSDLDIKDLNYMIFLQAYHGYIAYKSQGLLENDHVITLIDFDQNSTEKRVYIIDVEKHQLKYHSYVAHGQGSGELSADHFSNKENSHQSSLGFYIANETYHGKHGLSLRLDGLEKGINDNARKRNVVIHSADYVSEDYIHKNNRLGRSWGCPALASENYEQVIDWIKGKSLLYIYSSKRTEQFPSLLTNFAFNP